MTEWRGWTDWMNGIESRLAHLERAQGWDPTQSNADVRDERDSLRQHVEELKTEISFTHESLRYCRENRDRLQAELDTWKSAEKQVSNAYLVLRSMIPGAYKTPTAPTAQQVYDTTEAALLELKAENQRLKAELGFIHQMPLDEKKDRKWPASAWKG